MVVSVTYHQLAIWKLGKSRSTTNSDPENPSTDRVEGKIFVGKIIHARYVRVETVRVRV